MKAASKTNEKKQQAQFLYMAGNKTQKEIAELVGTCERTVHSWVHQYAWDKLRLAAFRAPVTIADNLAAQIVELQNSIAGREVNNRFPNMQEAEITRKLVACYEKMKKFPSVSQSMQVLETFRNYIRPIDKNFARELGRYTTDFLEAKAANGYAPYQIEYGVDIVSPIMPGYDEVEGLDANKKEYVPCPDHLTCLYPGKCNYPYCMKEKEREITLDDYKVSPVLFTHNNPQKNDIAAEVTGSNPAISTSETRKNELSANPQITDAIRSKVPPIPNSKFPIPSLEPTGFNRDRFMELLKKLHSIANSDDGATPESKTSPIPTEENRSNPAIATSESRKNESTVLPQELGLKGSPPLGAEGFKVSAPKKQDNDLNELYAA